MLRKVENPGRLAVDGIGVGTIFPDGESIGWNVLGRCLFHHRFDGVAYPLHLDRVVFPPILPATLNRRIHRQRQALVFIQVVVERPLRSRPHACRIAARPATRHCRLLGKLGDLHQVLLVAQHPLAALFDQRVQQLGHLLVVGRIDGSLVDDEFADIVFDGFGHRLLALTDAFGQSVHRVGTALDDKLDQAHVIEGGNLLALLRPDVGVDQVAHRRLIRLEVDVVAAGQFHLVAHLGVVIHLGLDLFDFVGLVPRLGQFAGDAGIGAQQSGNELVEFQAFRLVVL